MNHKITNLYQRPSEKTVLDTNTVGKNIHLKIANSFDELMPIKEQWDAFVADNDGDIFLTFDWCRVWWKYYGLNRVLKVFVFRRQSRLVGIIPLFFEKVWLGPVCVKTVKIVGSDFTIPQFSVPIEHAWMEEVGRGFFTSISEDDWDIIHLGPIAGLYGHFDDLKTTFEKLFGHSYIVSSQNKGLQTYFKLTDTWEEYLGVLNRKERTKIRRHYRLAFKAAGDNTASIVACCATADNFEEIFRGFVQMHQQHWQKLGRPGHFGDWHYALEFHHELAKAQLKQKRLCLFKISLGDWCLGYKYGYIFGDDYVDFLDARSDCKELANVGLGRIIYSEMIKKVILEKSKWINSMRGKYKHKLEMGGTLLPTRNLYVIPKKPTTVMRIRLFRLFAHLLNFCYYRIWYSRVAPRLPLKRRGLWKIWIRTNAFS